VKHHLEALKEVFTLGLKAEMFTAGGKVNLITVGLGFLIAAGSDLSGGLQDFLRFLNSSYSAGPDDSIAVFVVWIMFALGCVFLLLRYGGTAQLPPQVQPASEPPPALPPSPPKQLNRAPEQLNPVSPAVQRSKPQAQRKRKKKHRKR
jgi:hypothetical protein